MARRSEVGHERLCSNIGIGVRVVSEMYREMGLGEIGHLPSCQRDATFCEGYDKRMRLKRTQTIMQGASHCDFHYTLVDDPKVP